VFAAIAASAARLCDAYDAAIHRVDGDFLPVVAHHGPIPVPSKLPLRAGFFVGRAVLDQRTIHISDVQTAADEYPEGSDRARELGFRTILAVPLIRASTAIGVISIRRLDVRPFIDRQIELLKTFASQAVIAIENTRLFEEVHARTRDLTESLEQQTATADVLKVISRSALDVQKVLDALVESAARLCNAYDAVIFQVFGDGLCLVAHHGQIPTTGPVGQHTVPLARGRMSGRAVIDRRTIHVADILAEADEYPVTSKLALHLGWRTGLAVPLVHAGVAIGAIWIRRTEVRPFTERQIELVNTFADQAVIAIENTRLFEAEQTRTKELTESLEYQTVISDVLSVISKSPNNLQPVLDAILATAQRLCQAEYATCAMRKGDGLYHILASGSADPKFIEWQSTRPMSAGDGSMIGLVAADNRTLHFPDALAEPRFTDLARQQQSKARSMLGVPPLRAGDAVGVIFLARTVVQPFTDRQIGLVSTFADQAMIAIENARLFEEVQARTRELTETLEYQTATSDVLNVISRSPGELESVFQAMLANAVRICEAKFGTLYLRDGDAFRAAALHNAPPAFVEFWQRGPHRPGASTVLSRVLRTKEVVHISDIAADQAYIERDPLFIAAAELGGFRTVLAVPKIRSRVRQRGTKWGRVRLVDPPWRTLPPWVRHKLGGSLIPVA
jgi:GAF domain-containing protein